MSLEEIKHHQLNKNCVKITRNVSDGITEMNKGYIVDHSTNFLLLQETGDFRVLGYLVISIKQIAKIRFNTFDKYYHKIMLLEGEADKVSVKYKIDLNNWRTIFKSIKKFALGVIVECESPDIETFTIEPILKTTSTQVYIQHFDAKGFIDEDPVDVDFEDITIVKFDDRYINVFSKYLRKRKPKKA